MEKEEIEEEQKKTNLFGIFRKIPIMAIIFPPIGIMMLIKFYINKLERKYVKGDRENG
ncbi:MAG: hypothetical protein HOK72_13365 [Flavobacteriales bacterium]|nr:hypothetical protein [Flavobacteriales bacterium]